MGDTSVATTVPVGTRLGGRISADPGECTVEGPQEHGAPETGDNPEEIDAGNIVQRGGVFRGGGGGSVDGVVGRGARRETEEGP